MDSELVGGLAELRDVAGGAVRAVRRQRKYATRGLPLLAD